MTYEYKQYLAHHGVKGQKWGIRRYQNEDGTLTPEGQKKYGWYYSGQINRLAREKNKTDYKKPETIERKQKEYDDALKKAERSRIAAYALTYGMLAYSVGSIANMLTGGRLKQFSKNILGKAVNEIRNNKTAFNIKHEFAKRQAYKKAGSIVLNKKNYKIFGSGLQGR